jgi:hypothetical protein
MLKDENKIKTTQFEFKKVSISLVDKLIKKQDTSCGPGVSRISTKILKQLTKNWHHQSLNFLINALKLK